MHNKQIKAFLCRMYEKKIILSADGSHTIELVGKNEQYHSIHGAIQESNHIFIKHGLEILSHQKRQLNILEVGMGTGLNILLSYQYALQHQLSINYTAVEAFPLEEAIWKQLNYADILGDKLSDIYQDIHHTEWNHPFGLCNTFEMIKINGAIQDIRLSDGFYDLVYFDAFNPDLEPMLWTKEMFAKVYRWMNKNSLLSTYSTKGIVKRALKNSGFSIEKKPGPPGKREILNAIKGELARS